MSINANRIFSQPTAQLGFRMNSGSGANRGAERCYAQAITIPVHPGLTTALLDSLVDAPCKVVPA
jgi:dTDP-4-amino-4,6-dideoxygalactose transaminase